jgi:hypothetical protein
VLIALNLKYTSTFNSSSDPGTALVSPIAFRQAQVLFSLFSAALPALNQYLRKFDTSQATMFGYNANTYGSGGRSYQLHSLTQNSKIDNTPRNYSRLPTDRTINQTGRTTANDFEAANANAQYSVTVQCPAPHTETIKDDGISQEDTSASRHNSDDFIIHKNVEYTVSHEVR